MKDVVYKKVLLKLSGEALAGGEKKGVDFNEINIICESIKQIVDLGVEVSVVCGGGNFWRGALVDMDRTTSDYIGMLATTMNGLVLQSTLESMGVDTRFQTAIEMREIAEPYIKRKAARHLNKGRVVIFGCGSGNPYFTTDTAAALRAAEMEAEIILVAKTIDGVYCSDPKINKNAVKYSSISFNDVIAKDLHIMDLTAITLCKTNNIKLLVFELAQPQNIVKAVCGEKIGTLIS